MTNFESPSGPKEAGSAANQCAAASTPLSLSKKLELLEARFGMPPPSAANTVQACRSPSPALLRSPNDSRSQQHSFSFDTPTLSTSSSIGFHSNHSATASNLPSTSIRQKRRKSTSSRLDLVISATEEHMRKVAAKLPLHEGERSLSGFRSPVSSASGSSTSQQTLRTGHRAPQQTQLQRPRVVKESPPAGTGTPKYLKVLTNADLESPPQVRKSTTAPNKKGNDKVEKVKRKASTPLKREQPSVRTSSARSAGRSASSRLENPRKRSRQHLPTENQGPVTPSKFTFSEQSTNSQTSLKTCAKAPAPATAAPTKSRTAKNAKLEDFFSFNVKKQSNKALSKPTKATTSEKPSATPATDSTTTMPSQEKRLGDTNIPERDDDMGKLRRKCQELEQKLLDKDAQLLAVTNNKTIMHTAIEAALKEREQELEAMKKKRQRYVEKSGSVIEKLIRSQTFREAKDLREKLAADGARLGRIVYTRAGIRSVETWEDGHASRHLQKMKAELKEKLKTIELRQRAAQKAVDNFLESLKENNGTQRQTGDFETDSSETIRSELEAMEAVESARFASQKVRKKLKDVEDDEKALNDEKVEHIRAVKRLANEDASRFHSRPKLHGRYVLRSLLGKGGFSEVWRAYDLFEIREVAVKIHQLDPRWSESKKENYTKHVSREYEIHRNVRHPRIVSLFDVFEIDTNSFATVLECCNGTDLDTLLKKEKRLPERDARVILLQILSGMHYLSRPSADGSRQGIIHYDLKPGNILFDTFGDAKITDFGLSKIIDTTDPGDSMELTSQGAGTYWYLPPECFVMTDNVRISNKVDVWSIGVIYYQMLFGKRPFGEGQSQDKILTDHTMLNAREVNFPEHPKVSTLGKKFLRECLTYDQSFRPNVAQICQHEYVSTKDFS